MNSESIRQRLAIAKWAAAPRRDLLKKVTLITSLLVGCSIFLFLERMPGNHHLTASTQRESVGAGEPLERIKAALAAKSIHSSTELVDHVMMLANRYTVPLMDDWHDRNWNNRDVVLTRLCRAIEGDDAARPHSSCGPRCMIMAWVLQFYGIASRQVAILSSNYPRLVGHQQIEVLNPDSGRWELYDPTWDVHFLDEKSGLRVSALDMHFRPLRIDREGKAVFDGVLPSNHDGSLRGWDALYPFSGEQSASIANCADYGAVMYYCYQTLQPLEILINARRFDIRRTWNYPELGLVQTTFDSYCRKVYANHSFHVLHERPTGDLADRIEHPVSVPTY
jgi:hypothetical protein